LELAGALADSVKYRLVLREEGRGAHSPKIGRRELGESGRKLNYQFARNHCPPNRRAHPLRRVALRRLDYSSGPMLNVSRSTIY
jgi:hypothetical protein